MCVYICRLYLSPCNLAKDGRVIILNAEGMEVPVHGSSTLSALERSSFKVDRKTSVNRKSL